MEPQKNPMWLKALGLALIATVVIVALVRDRIVNQPYNQVSISGTGVVAYQPDTARVTLGVNIESPTAQSALAQLDATIARVLPAIEALGIASDKISTHSLSVYPQYYYPSDAPSAISGYTANQQISIEIDIASSSSDIVGRVIQTASAQGANQVTGVVFDASNIEELRQEAVLKAIADAQSRAEGVADAAGVKLGDVMSWWENPISVPGDPVFAYERGYGYGGDMGMGGGYGGPTIPGGTSEVIMQVTLNYETK